MKKIICANWKKYITSSAQAREILDATNEYLGSFGENINFSLIFCPPTELMADVSELLKESELGIVSSLGSQDMLENMYDARYVIIGHSDRRWGLGETDKEVNQKLKNALSKNISPIVCLGEKTRDEDYMTFLINQTKNTFSGLREEDISKCLVAYEPVWAISGSLGANVDSPELAAKSVETIKNILEIDVVYLYGGSVTSQNVNEFTSNLAFSGVMIGKASTEKEEFIDILRQL